MIVERLTLRVKRGKVQELIALHHNPPRIPDRPLDSRIMTCKYGQQGVAVIEFSFEDQADCESYWEAWFALPETEAWMTKFNASHGGSVSTEIWVVE